MKMNKDIEGQLSLTDLIAQKDFEANNDIETLSWLKDYDYHNWQLRQELRKSQGLPTVDEIKIEIHPSYIKIKNYMIGDCPELESQLRAINRLGELLWTDFIYKNDEKALYISSGINVNYLSSIFCIDSANFIDKTNSYSEYDRVEFSVNREPRDKIQEEAIDFLSNLNQYESLELYSQKILALRTGFGKTFCSLKSLEKIKRKALIIIHTSGLMEQWEKCLSEYTDITTDQFLVVRGRAKIDKVMKMSFKEISQYKIIFATHRTLENLASEDPKVFSDFMKKIRVGIKIYDECHKEIKAINVIDFSSDIRDTWYLTATPGRSDKQENEIFQFSYSSVPRFGEETRYKDPYHNIWLVNYNSKPSYGYLVRCQSKYGFNIVRYSQYAFKKGWFTLGPIFFSILDKIVKRDGKIAILVPTNENVIFLKNEITSHFKNEYKVGTYTSIIKDKNEKEKELDSKIIISTEKSLGVGMDIKNLKFMLLFIPTKSNIVLEQILGRLREIPGKKVFFIDFCDFGFPNLAMQRKRRMDVYDLKAKDIHVFEMRTEDEIKRDKNRLQSFRNGMYNF